VACRREGHGRMIIVPFGELTPSNAVNDAHDAVPSPFS
jgi:hypothetical protein